MWEGMILLATASDRAQECATVLQDSTAQATHCAKNLYEALGFLRSTEYVAVVLDQCLLDADSEDAYLVLQHLGTAIPVAVNCALCGIDRVAREVSAALKRREVEVNNARKSAEASLRSELRDPLTAVLLNCDLLQEMCGLPRAALEKIAVIQEKALDLAGRIHVKEELASKA